MGLQSPIVIENRQSSEGQPNKVEGGCEGGRDDADENDVVRSGIASGIALNIDANVDGNIHCMLSSPAESSAMIQLSDANRTDHLTTGDTKESNDPILAASNAQIRYLTPDEANEIDNIGSTIIVTSDDDNDDVEHYVDAASELDTSMMDDETPVLRGIYPAKNDANPIRTQNSQDTDSMNNDDNASHFHNDPAAISSPPPRREEPESSSKGRQQSRVETSLQHQMFVDANNTSNNFWNSSHLVPTTMNRSTSPSRSCLKTTTALPAPWRRPNQSSLLKRSSSQGSSLGIHSRRTRQQSHPSMVSDLPFYLPEECDDPHDVLLERISDLELKLSTLSRLLMLQQQQHQQQNSEYPPQSQQPHERSRENRPTNPYRDTNSNNNDDVTNKDDTYEDFSGAIDSNSFLDSCNNNDDEPCDEASHHNHHNRNLSLMLLYEGNQVEYERQRIHGDGMMLASMTVAERNWLGPQILLRQQQQHGSGDTVPLRRRHRPYHWKQNKGNNGTPTISDDEDTSCHNDDDDLQENAAKALFLEEQRRRQQQQQQKLLWNQQSAEQGEEEEGNSILSNRRQQLDVLEKTFRTKLTDLFEKPIEENQADQVDLPCGDDKQRMQQEMQQDEPPKVDSSIRILTSNDVAHTDISSPMKFSSITGSIPGDGSVINNISETSKRNNDTEKARSKWLDYLNSFQESTPDVDDHMEEFIKVPGRVEIVMTYGFFICVDSFLYMFTILPIRVVWNCFLLFINVLQIIGLVRKSSTKKYLQFHRQHTYQIIQVLIIYTVYRFILCRISIGKLYHWIRGQSMIKLYVIIAMVEIFDRLFSSLGQDCLDSMYWNTVSRPKSIRMLISIMVVLIYVSLHTMILFVHVSTLNVAMNSADQALLTLLISGNFAEIKSTVFKKYNKPALFKITAGDICERFKLALFLSLILLLNICQGMNQVQLMEYFRICCIVWAAELIADWIKHSFITKFNYLPSSVYPEYALILAGDVTGFGHENINLDHSHAVVKRIGFSQIPLIAVMFRLVKEALKYASMNLPALQPWLAILRGLQQPMYFSLYIVTEGGMYVAVWFLLLLIKLALGSALQRISRGKLQAAPDLLSSSSTSVGESKKSNKLSSQGGDVRQNQPQHQNSSSRIRSASISSSNLKSKMN